jgi:hypothetical protein
MKTTTYTIKVHITANGGEFDYGTRHFEIDLPSTFVDGDDEIANRIHAVLLRIEKAQGSPFLATPITANA